MATPISIPGNTSIIPVNTTSIAKTITLPSVQANPGRILIIKDMYGSASTQSINISTTGADTIEKTFNNITRLSTSYGAWMFTNDGVSSWFLIENYQNTLSSINRTQLAPFSPLTLAFTVVGTTFTTTWPPSLNASSYSVSYFSTSIPQTTGGTLIRTVSAGTNLANSITFTPQINFFYYATLTTTNANGTSTKTSALVTPSLLPAAPTNVTLQFGTTTLTSSWTPVANATSYTVTVYQNPSTFYQSISGLTVPFYVFQGTTIDELFYYATVQAINSSGGSLLGISPLTLSTLNPATISSVTIQLLGINTICVWTSAANATSYIVQFYSSATPITTGGTLIETGTSTSLNQTSSVVLINGTYIYATVLSVNKYGTPLQTFNPTTITGCVLWLDGADISTFSFSSGILISQWRDKSGNGNTATPFGTGTTVNYLADRGAVFFPGSSGLRTSLVTPTNRVQSGFFVVNVATGTGLNAGVIQGCANSSGGRQFRTQGTLITLQENTSALFTSGTTLMNTLMLVGYTDDGTTITHNVNGTIVSGTSATAFTAGTAVTVGYSFNTEFMIGYIYETIVYSTTLTTIQRQQIEGYLAWKWGINSRLPISHPYFYLSPSAFSVTSATAVGPILNPPQATTQVTMSISGINRQASWLAATNATSYAVTFYQTSTPTPIGGTIFQTATTASLTQTTSTLLVNGLYYYAAVQSINQYGTSGITFVTNNLTITANPPQSVSSASLTANGAFIIASWQSGFNATTYTVVFYQSDTQTTSGGSLFETTTTTNLSQKLNLIQLSSITKYYYATVQAVNPFGTATVITTSNAVQLLVAPVPPETVSISLSGYNAVCTWTAGLYTASYTVRFYYNTVPSNVGGIIFETATLITQLSQTSVNIVPNGFYIYAILTSINVFSTITKASSISALTTFIPSNPIITLSMAAINILISWSSVYTTTTTAVLYYNGTNNSNTGGSVIGTYTGFTGTSILTNETITNAHYYYAIVQGFNSYGSSSVITSSAYQAFLNLQNLTLSISSTTGIATLGWTGFSGGTYTYVLYSATGNNYTSGTVLTYGTTTNTSITISTYTPVYYYFTVVGTVSGRSTILASSSVIQSTYSAPSGPSAMSGLLIWNDASKLTGTTGTTINTWTNLGDGTTYVTTTTGTLNLAARNSLNTVLMTTGQTWTISTQPNFATYSMFWSGRQTGGANARVLNSTSNNQLFGYWGGQKKVLYIDNNPSFLSNTASDTVWDTMSHTRIANGAYTMNWDGNVIYTGAGSTSNNLTGLTINANGEASNVEVGELILFNVVLTTTDIQTLEGYLAWKWGSQANLPAGHPYKSAAPISSPATVINAYLITASNIATMRWSAFAGATGYTWILFTTSTLDYTGTVVSTGTTASSTVTATYTGLTLSNYYYFSVYAITSSTPSGYSTSPLSLYNNSVPSGGAITLNAFTDVTFASVTISALAMNTTGYIFYLSTTTSTANAIYSSVLGNATTFQSTGADQTYVVPSGITSLTVYLWGAGGGSTISPAGSGTIGGAGAYLSGTLTVTPNETLTIISGRGGANSLTTAASPYGGGGAPGGRTDGWSSSGGGRSAIRRGATDIVTVGAGGGGRQSGIAGGSGGITIGGSGTGSATGGTQTAGGAGANAGSFNAGGNGGQDNSAGGGSGYYGGGGGSQDNNGGGGSSFFTNLSSYTGVISSDGYTAPYQYSPYYVSGVANGATYAGGGTGGNGLVVLSYGTGVTNQYTANQTINFYVNLSSYVNTTLYAILVPSNSFGTGSQVTSSRAVPGPPTGGSITLNAFTSTTGGSVTITGLGTNATKYAFYISTTTSIANAILAYTSVLTTYTYTGAIQSYTVPSTFSVIGAYVSAAGGGGGSSAGAGALVTGTLSVTPGSTLTIYVGGTAPTVLNAASAGGWPGGGPALGGEQGGGGGGYSAIASGSTYYVIAGAGGGGTGYGGRGGNGGFNGSPGVTVNGNAPAQGGTQTAGGAASSGGGGGSAGSYLQGGNASPATYDGGGGGGGYYGGGGGPGGGAGALLGGGGGGSSLTSGPGFAVGSVVSGGGAAASTNGQVIISNPTNNPAAYTLNQVVTFTAALTSGTAYYAILVPQNNFGSGTAVVSTSQTTPSTPVGGSIVLNSLTTSGGTVTITAATNATNYTVYISTTTSSANSVFSFTTTTTGSAVAFTTTLAATTTYFAVLLPSNAAGNGTFSNSAGVTTPAANIRLLIVRTSTETSVNTLLQTAKTNMGLPGTLTITVLQVPSPFSESGASFTTANYDVILIYNNNMYTNTSLGTNLNSFIANGGSVIVTTFSFQNNGLPGFNFANSAYQIGTANSTTAQTGFTATVAHPITSGVGTNFSFTATAYSSGNLALQSGATTIATANTSGFPLIGIKTVGSARQVGINSYTDTSFSDTTGNFQKLVCRAIYWCRGII